MKAPHVNVLDGSTFAVSDTKGDMAEALGEMLGLFFQDTRHLSRWDLTVNGRAVDTLSAANVDYDEAAFFLVVPTGTIYRNPTLCITRRREIGNGMHEHLMVENEASCPARLELSLRFDADFADIFELKDHLPKQGEVYRHVDGPTAVLGYRRDDFGRETHIRAEGAYLTEQSLTYRVEIGPHDRWETRIRVQMVTGTQKHQTKRRLRTPNMGPSLDEWLDGAPRLECQWDDLRRTYDRSLVDLAALRFYPGTMGGASLPAAGLPWFMALFGRDAIVTSYQALPFFPELARTTLRALAVRQATACDDFRDAAPGKILHELRHGELVHFGERPQSPYYGSADVTPLFLILLDEYERWTGDGDTVRHLQGAARAALAWMDDDGDRDGDGYIEYQTRNPETGLVNQCWKDSWNSIVHPDGSLAALPRATCEIQGYAYDARRRAARLARVLWDDPALADRLEQQAADLQRRFDEDFWVADGHFYALALDGHKKQVATLSSNMGQLLWSGIVPEERVADVASHLLGDRMFSGWGVRTLAMDQGAYNPVEYHNGTVWPHDNAFIAAGLARYGRRDDASTIARSILQAARSFDHRLPEVFAGFDRRATTFPVEYPTACSPQAWATGTPLLLLRVLLGLEPEGDSLRVDPRVPTEIGAIRLSGIPGRWGTAQASADAAR